ncbi:Aminodeoxychorismate lyase [Penicillium rolfsii]|nr:Aminodeoxychorismate lyase [Penicillium rolfsii]
MASITNAAATPSFQIISSLRFDPDLPKVTSRHVNNESYPAPAHSPYYLLSYHRDRLINAARYFEWDHALEFLRQDLESFERFLDDSIPDVEKPWRLRIAVDYNGKGSVEVNPTVAMDPLNLLIPSLHASTQSTIWKVYVDSQTITPSGFTTHKTTARDDYTAARVRAGISSPAETSEVLVVNPNGEIMEGSITTPYFQRHIGGKETNANEAVWVTPPLTCGGNAGTSRRYALSQGFCVEQVITKADLVDGEKCWLSNGVRGFMRGVVVLT